MGVRVRNPNMKNVLPKKSNKANRKNPLWIRPVSLDGWRPTSTTTHELEGEKEAIRPSGASESIPS